MKQQREQRAQQHLKQHAPEGQLRLHEQRIDEARIPRKQAVIPQRRGEIGRGAGIDQLKRRQAGHQQVKRRQRSNREENDQTWRQRPARKTSSLRINSRFAQSAVPERRKLATACSCAAFMTAAPVSCPVTTCSTALLMTSPTTGNSFTV